MAQATITYTEEQFIEDVRQVFATSQDARDQAQGIADHMRRIIATGWPESSDKFGPKPGTYPIYTSDDLGHPNAGFRIFTYRSAPRRAEQVQSPHDHGACFVVYGVARGANQQTVYAWTYGDDRTQQPTLEPQRSFLQRPGDVDYFLPGTIHSTEGSCTEETVYVRITSEDLEKVWRHRYNLATSTSRAFLSGAGPQA